MTDGGDSVPNYEVQMLKTLKNNNPQGFIYKCLVLGSINSSLRTIEY